MLRKFFYNLKYLTTPPWDTGIPAPELVQFIAGKQPGKFLDIGCGTGTNLLFLVEHHWKVTGVDISEIAVRKARKKLRNFPFKIIAADITKINIQTLFGPFDLVLDMGCFHSLLIMDRKIYINQLANLIKLDGNYLLYTFQPASGNRQWGITKEQILELFGEQFEILKYEQGSGRPSAWYYFRRT